MIKKNVGLIVGGNGIVGRNLAKYITTLNNWEVIVTSQKDLSYETTAQYVKMNLLDESAVVENASALSEVTHVFFAGYMEKNNLKEQTEVNLTLLRNLINGLEKVADQLEHVTFIQGGKAYGAHLGIYKTPALETASRHFPPNFYYDQEDFLRIQSVGKKWSWTAVRPDIIIGYAIGNPMNLASVIAVYATLCKELNVPFRFPGSNQAYEVLVNITDAEILSKGMEYVAANSICHNEIFNITNGDIFRWKHVWPVFADYFGLEIEEPQYFSLREYMADKEDLWKKITEKYGLDPYSINDLANWPFGDFIFNVGYDAFFDVNKLRRFGFSEMHKPSVDSFLEAFETLRSNKIIP